MSMKLNLSINLPAEVKSRALALSQTLAQQYDAYFVLGEEAYPHITVYAADFPDNALPRVLEATQGVVAKTEPLHCRVTQVESHQGYIGVEVNHSSAIARFHQAVLDALSPWREVQSYQENQTYYGVNFTLAQIEHLNRYGYADAVELYNPHFSLSRFKNEREALHAVDGITWDIPEFTTRSCGLYVMGDSHGTCKQLLREFVLG